MGKRSFPIAAKQRKWYKYKRDAKVGDVILRKDETAASQTYKYARIVNMHVGLDGRVRDADVEYKVPRESKFRVTTRPIHKLALVVPVEEQTMEDPEVPEDEQGSVEEEAEERSDQGGISEEEETGEERGRHESDVPGAPDPPILDDIIREEDPREPEVPNEVPAPPCGNLRITYQSAGEDIRDVGQAVKRGRGQLQKGEMYSG
jgi:hypothetical protein